MKLTRFVAIFALGIAPTVHAYTNAEDAASGFTICKNSADATAKIWKIRQGHPNLKAPSFAANDKSYTHPIAAKMDEVLAKDINAYADATDAGMEVFAYCQDNLERLVLESRARGEN